MSCAMQCVISIDQLNCPFKTNYTYGSFCKEKKKVARTNKKALIGFICLIRAQLGGRN